MDKKVLFFVYPIPGPFNASVRITNILTALGREVTYVAPKGTLEQYKSKYNFRELSVFLNYNVPHWKRYIHLIWHRREYRKKIRRNHEILRSEVHDIMCDIQPDFILIDQDVRYFLNFIQNYHRVFLISTTLAFDRRPNVPPPMTKYKPDNTLFSKLNIELLWTMFTFKYLIDYFFNAILIAEPDINSCVLERVLNKQYYSNIGFLSEIPQILLYTKEFDYSKPQNHKTYYAGPMVEMNRTNESFSWPRFKSNQKIIYCSFGTASHGLKLRCTSFLRKLINVIGNNKNYVLLISFPNWKSELGEIQSLSNIFLYDFVPQLTLLEKADLMIGHAGTNSIKECIIHETPMIVYPLNKYTDQNGCAALIEHHELGLKGKLDDSESRIESTISRIFNTDLYTRGIKKMRENFLKCQIEESEFVRWMINYYQTPFGSDKNKYVPS